MVTRPLEGDWPYVWLGSTYAKLGQASCVVSLAVIIATSVNNNGRREVVGMEIGPSETETYWAKFLRKRVIGRRDRARGTWAVIRFYWKPPRRWAITP